MSDTRASFPGFPSLFSAGVQCGFSVEAVLSQAGIALEAIDRLQPEVPLATFRRVFDACVEASSTGYFPLALGDTFAFDYGPELTTFLTSSMTLRDAIRLFDWLPLVVHSVLRVDVVEGDAFIAVRFDCTDHVGASFTSLNEALAAAIFKFGRQLMPGSVKLLARVDFKHETHLNPAMFRAHFGVPVHFGQTNTQLLIERSAFDQPLMGAMPQVHAIAELKLMQFAERRLSRASAAERVLKLLQQQPDLLGSSLDKVAETLSLHTRKLQRLLQDEHTRYADLLAQARHERAIVLLADPHLDIESISLKLGFTDRRAFTLAFQRWTGHTPSAFRKLP